MRLFAITLESAAYSADPLLAVGTFNDLVDLSGEDVEEVSLQRFRSLSTTAVTTAPFVLC